jgi:hypothetical protein
VFPADPLDVTVSLAIGADINADPATWVWTDVTPLVREDRKISITRGRRSRVGQVVATTVSATADNTDGALCRHNPNGPHFGVLKKNTPMKVEIDGVTRAAVFVPGFPPSWDPSETDQTVTLNGVGLLDRLGRGRTLRSALYQTMIGVSAGDYVPHAYWSMEDGADATGFGSALPSVLPMSLSGPVTPAAYGGVPGSRRLPTFATGSSASATVPTYAATSKWIIQVVVSVPTEPAGAVTILEARTSGGTARTWRLVLTPGAPSLLSLKVYDAAGALIDTNTIPLDNNNPSNTDDSYFYGSPFMIMVGSEADGSDYNAWLAISDGITDNGAQAAVLAGTRGNLTSIKAYGAVDGITIGHLAVFVDPLFNIVTDAASNATGMHGHSGEQAHERIARLCREERVRVSVTATVSAAMGPQLTGNLLTNLRDCANADLGILYETMDFGLGYRALSERYNATAAITLQYDQSHILPPWEPDDDDQEYFNDVTASRPGGSSARSADEDDIDEVGSYAIPANPNVDADDQLANYASWLKSLGLIDELSWPAVRPNLYESGALRTAWLAAEIGDELHITGHPSPLAPDTIRQVIEGYTETIGSFTWTASAVLSSASPYIVAELDSPTLGKLDTSGSALHAAVTSTATTFEVATTTSGRAWSTDNAQDGFDWYVGGERVTVTDIAPSAITYVSAGTASSGSSGSRTPGMPGSVASGDLVLIFASTRNSGTGVANTPTSWTRLPIFEAASNAQVFGRIYDGVWSMPTVTYTGGAANEDTIAQSAAFRGKFHDIANVVVGHASCLNASAQDITAPGLPVNQLPADLVVLYLGWKADDYTSVAAPGSWTEIQEASSTAGNDASQVWGYRIFSSVPAVGSLSPAIAVTGGASAISRGAVVAIRCDYQTATVTRSSNGVVKAHSAGADVRLWTPWRWAL